MFAGISVPNVELKVLKVNNCASVEVALVVCSKSTKETREKGVKYVQC